MAGLSEQLDALLSRWRFQPHPALRGGHAQTLAANLWPRRLRHGARLDAAERRLVEVEPGVRVLLRCCWQEDRARHPTLLLVHGLEGSSESGYLRGAADKALARGWSVVRMNLRNCGGTEHLTPTLYHSGQSGDVRAVVSHLLAEGLPSLLLCGFSLGGNLVLRLAGEYGAEAPAALRGVAAISAAADLSAAAQALEAPHNRLYQLLFVRGLVRRVARKSREHPDRYDRGRLRGVRTVREFDERFTATAFGFAGAADYYERASAAPLLPRVRVPTLILHAADDPFVPLTGRVLEEAARSPLVRVHLSERGGHVGFLAARDPGEDRHWAENRALEFLACCAGTRGGV